LSFGHDYSGFYDWLYADKDYAGECDRLEQLFRRFAPAQVRSILDLGCGTGGHAIPLAARGYEVVGVDRSEDMIAQAVQKQAAREPSVERLALTFRRGDLQGLDLERRFDAALMMFAVLGYQTTNREVSAALAAARRHLEPGGLLVFDVWYGPAVLSQRPVERVKVLETPQGELHRAATPVLDVQRHLCLVRYRLRLADGDGRLQEFAEDHPMRYFFPMELEQFLTAGRFEPVHLSDAADLDAEPTLDTWNVLACARAV
jgi:SAM-dependent methyltransferase